MAITIDGTGTITGITAGGLPDGVITAPDLSGAQSGSAPIFGARAWVCFNGTGTVAIRSSGNVSSITDNGTGTYTVNFATALPDANYATCVTSQPNTADTDLRVTASLSLSTAPTTSAVRIVCGFTHTTGNVDKAYLSVVVFD